VVASLLGLWVRIPPGYGYVSVVSVVCCHLEVSATGRSLVQGSPTWWECLIVCEPESSKPGSPRPDLGYRVTRGKTPTHTSLQWCFASHICSLSATAHL
jgi:hypothetical protein